MAREEEMLPGEEALVWLTKMYPIVRKIYGVQKIGIFGPAARGEPLSKPGLDILVEFEPHSDSYRNFAGLWEYLEQGLARPVDLVTGRTLAEERAKNTGWIENADPDRLLIGRAYEECRFIARLRAEQRSMETWRRDETLRRAVVLSLVIIGRAADLISPRLKESHPGIQWTLLTGFSEKLFMPYHEPDWTFVWDAVDREIPSLEHVFRTILAER
jgi:uncharacterized protein